MTTREQIEQALRAAAEAARAAAPGGDGGTCNLDTAVFWPDRTRSATIEAAATAAGVTVSISEWLGRCVFVHVGEGQGDRRTRMARAAADALEAHGLNASVYYQMD